MLQGYLANTARCDVLGVSVLWQQASIIVLTSPFNMIVHPTSQRAAALVVTNGLYFARFRLSASGLHLDLDRSLSMPVDALISVLTGAQPEAASLVVAGAEHKAHHRALLWAVRFGCGSDGLKKLLPASRGIDLAGITSSTALFIDSDAIRRGTIMRTKPVRQAVAPADAPITPGSHWQLDGYGHIVTMSVVDKSTYQWLILDAVSDVGYADSCKSSDQTSCFAFLDKWHAAEVALGHTPREVRVDAAPNLNTDLFREACAQRYGVHVPPAAGDDHDWIPKCEAAQDPLTRCAEADIKRAEKGRGYFLLAREYALLRRNFRVKSGATKSLLHLHMG